MTMPVQTFRDLMDRTVANYEFIKSNATERGPYEVTQLISSFIMVAGLPRERDIYNRLEKINLNEARSSFGLPDFPVMADAADYGIRHMADLAGMFRNAVAHGNITFFPDVRGGRIGTIQFSDRRERNKTQQRRTTSELTLDQIEQTLYAFQKLAHHLYDQEMSASA